MLNRSLPWLLLLSSSAVIAQTQYGQPGAPHAQTQSRPQTGCPWLTEGSAAHALGGDVFVTVTVAEPGEGSCKFSRQPGSSNSLQIVVSKSPLPTCSSASTKLLGIGNEAASCMLPGSHGEAVEMVSSRVRDLHFTVTLVSRGSKGAAKSADPQDDALEQIAEQVAGNLY